MPARNDVYDDDLLRVAAKGGGYGPHSDLVSLGAVLLHKPKR